MKIEIRVDDIGFVSMDMAINGSDKLSRAFHENIKPESDIYVQIGVSDCSNIDIARQKHNISCSKISRG